MTYKDLYVKSMSLNQVYELKVFPYEIISLQGTVLADMTLHVGV